MTTPAYGCSPHRDRATDGGPDCRERTAGCSAAIAGPQGAIRREADQIEAAAGRGRFRRRRSSSTRREAERLVARRRRARQGGRRRRAALPLPALRRQRLRLRLLDRPRRVRGRGRHAADLRQADDRARALRAARRPVLRLDPARRPQRGDRPRARAPAGAVSRRSARPTSPTTATAAASASPTCGSRSPRCRPSSAT